MVDKYSRSKNGVVRFHQISTPYKILLENGLCLVDKGATPPSR